MSFIQIAHVFAGPLVDCETPIEQALVRALYDFSICADNDFRDMLHFGRKKLPPYDAPGHGIFMWPQAQIESYRADFLFVGRCGRDGSIDIGGKGRDDDIVIRLVVECDGHEFHDASKERAQYDRQRDRYMLTKGYRVLRFTGAELKRDAATCVQEIFHSMTVLQNERVDA